jgi:uncharacterized protein (TIGR00299 family) protein
MKKLIYVDCFSGISGDMFLGASLDAGWVERRFLEQKLSTLGLGKVKVVLRRVKRAALAATHLSFHVSTPQKSQTHRGFQEIRRLIEESGLTAGERQRATAIFQDLAEVEAKIHDVAVEDVHFHELGAVDSLLDIVGAAVVIEQLGIERAFVSKINVGSGFVETEHGLLPVPVPAAVALLQGLPIYSSGIEAELVTPTGAAILKHLSPEFGLPPARWQAIGYGAGSRDLESPNVLRLMRGEGLAEQPHGEEAAILETDIDDMNPQVLPYVQELLFQLGAQDVSWHALQMKKNRLGMRLYVLSSAEHVDALCETIFRETTTLGVRIHTVEKRRLNRKTIEVETPYGRVPVKLGLWNDRVLNLAPEYEDCARLAREKGVPLKEVLRVAHEAAHRTLKI